MVQYTTFLVAAAVLSATMPALADVSDPPPHRLNRRAAASGELYRGGYISQGQQEEFRRSLYRRGHKDEGKKKRKHDGDLSSASGDSGKKHHSSSSDSGTSHSQEYISHSQKSQEDRSYHHDKKPHSGGGRRLSTVHERDLPVEELFARIFERAIYDDLD